MPETLLNPASLARRRVGLLDVDAQDHAAVANAIEDLYAERYDVIVVRGAFDPARLAEVGARLDSDQAPGEAAWARPNETMPVEDVQLLGTDAPATPTFRAPRGVALSAYLDSAAAHAGEASAVFGKGYDAGAQIRSVLAGMAGGRPVDVARAADGRAYAPFTIRRLAAGRQIGVHHDYHYRLDLYGELSQQVDTRTLVSFVATLRTPLAGGELFVYGATSDATDLPRLANGFSFDLTAIEERYERACIATQPGDLFLLAAGRCLHRVGRVGGAQARITMGGFLALTQARDGVLVWS